VATQWICTEILAQPISDRVARIITVKLMGKSKKT